ncbi:hypothetical protein [Methylogaea oryzae]|uniref:hypothetical protein n=1 Tax=Methylogaea oryzae TaxID=1295382 RepID=UPI0006D06CA6|nr:hypothetical protein [Methylogaea oryzae]
MEAVLGVLLTSCVAIFGVIDGWFGQKIYDFATWAFAQLVEYFVLASIKFLLVVIPFAWDVAARSLPIWM